MHINIWTKGRFLGTDEDVHEQYVVLDRLDLWEYLKARLFHETICRLFGGFRGWTWLGSKKWAPDPFNLDGFDYEGQGRWHKHRRVPLYVVADLGCRLNTQQWKKKQRLQISVSEEEYSQLEGEGEETWSIRKEHLRPNEA